MCGRFRVGRKKEILEEEFGAEYEAANGMEWVPRYNVAPGQDIAVLRQDAVRPARRLSPMRCGLIPYWSKSASIGNKAINVRAESAASMSYFRDAFRSRRCMVPADGFYEWKREGISKTPFCFTMRDASMFAFAGLWERWRSPQGQLIESCAILTTAPNELVRDVHDRMPAILSPEVYDLWLDPGFSKVEELKPLLKPYPAAAMRRYRVSGRVNHVKYDDPECAAEIEPTIDEQFGLRFE